MDEGRKAFKILTSIPAGKRPLGRPRRRWEDNIRIYIKEIGINTVFYEERRRHYTDKVKFYFILIDITSLEIMKFIDIE